MDGELIAKRQRLNYVDVKAFGIGPDRARQQFQSISAPSGNTTHFDWEAAVETTSEYRLGHVQQPNIVPRHKSLSGLDQVCHAQEEAASDGVRSVASVVGELGTSGAHDTNEGHRDGKEDGEVCFGMVCHLLPVRPTDSSEAH